MFVLYHQRRYDTEGKDEFASGKAVRVVIYGMKGFGSWFYSFRPMYATSDKSAESAAFGHSDSVRMCPISLNQEDIPELEFLNLAEPMRTWPNFGKIG